MVGTDFIDSINAFDIAGKTLRHFRLCFIYFYLLLKMAKRQGNFESSASKKQKITDDLDDLWGDDPDIEDIDDCIMLATQAFEQVMFYP